MEENKGQILLYQTPDGESRIEVTLQGETVWLSLDQMAELFQRNKSTISRHIKNVFEEGELNADSTVAFFATVQTEGKRKVERDIAFYNLDMIISVGYRVHSYRGVQFRMWATKVLKEYIVKGFALNDDLLKRTEKGISKCECHNCVHLLASGETHRRRGTARREKGGIWSADNQYAFCKFMQDLCQRIYAS